MSNNTAPAVCSFFPSGVPKLAWYPLAAGQFWAFVVFLPGLARITSSMSRYLLFWSEWSLWPRLAVVTSLGLLLTASGMIIAEIAPRVWPRLRAVLAVVVLSLVGWRLLYLSCTLRSEHFIAYALACATLLICGALAAACRRVEAADLDRWQRRAVVFALPALPLYWATAWTYPAYRASTDPAVPPPRLVSWSGGKWTNSVYIIVMDEWSTRLSLCDGALTDMVPNLRLAAESMCVFTQAHAAGCHTSMSMPRMLFQSTDEYVIRGGNVGFVRVGRFEDVGTLPCLFDAPRRRGYRTYLVGWYHPYHVLLGGRVDHVRATMFHDWLGDDHLSQAWQFGYEGLENLVGRGAIRAAGMSRATLRNLAFVNNVNRIELEIDTILGDPVRPQFAVLHLPLPHAPFCFGPDGMRPLDVDYPMDEERSAAGQLRYADQVVGGILERLRRQDKYDDAIVVITSDHNWRRDPHIRPHSGEDWSHVPLLIKLPGQSRQARIDAPVNLVRLEAMLEGGAACGWDVDAWSQLLASGEYAWSVPDDEANIDRHRVSVR